MIQNPSPTAVIIGGGIGGLTAAYRLTERCSAAGIAVKIHLVESASRLGGVIRTFREGDFLFEGGPDCFISEKKAGIRLTHDLGLDGELLGTTPQFRAGFILSRGKLRPVPQGLYLMAPSALLPFARSPLMSWRGKLRAGMDLFLPRNPPKEDESLASFVRRRLGKEMLEKVAQPMISGIYTADPEKLSLRATMPQFLEWEEKYGSVIRGIRRRKSTAHASGPRYGLFVTYREGMEALIRRLAERLVDTLVHLNTQAVSLRPERSGWRVQLANDSSLQADWVFVATPCHQAAALTEAFAPKLAELLRTVPYASSLILNFAYRSEQISDQMKGMGFVIPAVERKSLMACSFTHRKYAHRCPEGFALLRAFAGGAMNEGLFEKEDAEIIRLVQSDLEQILRISGPPQRLTLTRWRQSMPQYSVGHMARVEAIEKELSRHPGLELVGNGYRGVGTPDVIASAERAVDQILPATRP
ncbi:MAG: protoporphyrinogen oxidase [Pseudomonadota bacterium]